MSTTSRGRVDAAHVSGDDATSVDTGEKALATDPTDDASWVDRCQRQFTSGDACLPNLADDTNHAMHDGV